VFLHVDIKNCGFLCTYVAEFKAGVELNQSSDIQANTQIAGSAQYETDVGTIDLPGFWTYFLYWQPQFEVKVGVSASGQLTVTLHATEQISLEAGAQWNDDHRGHSGWQNLSHATSNGTFDVPYVQASVTAEAYAKAEFSVLLFDVIGPDVSAKIGLVFDLAIPRCPFAELKVALTGALGLHIDVFGFWEKDFNVDLPEIDIPIGQSPEVAPFILSTSPPDGTSASLDSLQFQVSAYSLEDGTNLTYAWTDEAGNLLGTTNPLTAALSVGTHDVTVAVADSCGGQTAATIHGVTVTCASTAQCNGVCVNFASDAKNCGSCGNVCASGQRCTNRTCCTGNVGDACGCGGTVQCDGRCSAPAPTTPCGCGGTVQCDGSCSNPGPGNLGQLCECGTGTIQCDGSCSGSCGFTANFSNIDYDAYIWQSVPGFNSDTKNAFCKINTGNTPRSGSCDVDAWMRSQGLTATTLIVKIGNSNCANSHGDISFVMNGNKVWSGHKGDTGLLTHCGWTYRAVVQVDLSAGTATLQDENFCHNATDCPF
jgi:hypothetical protein